MIFESRSTPVSNPFCMTAAIGRDARLECRRTDKLNADRGGARQPDFVQRCPGDGPGSPRPVHSAEQETSWHACHLQVVRIEVQESMSCVRSSQRYSILLRLRSQSKATHLLVLWFGIGHWIENAMLPCHKETPIFKINLFKLVGALFADSKRMCL